MKKIIIVGIGLGGILAAEKLSALDYNIEVYEQRKRDELAYDWHDDVAKAVFARVGLPLPEDKYYFEKKNWSFFAPFSDNPVRIKQDKDKLDYSMERRPLLDMLIKRVPPKVKIHYDTKVSGLLIENEKVTGIVLENGESIKADLVIDSAGAKSALRRNLPDCYGIQKRASVNELFYAYRAFFENSGYSGEIIDTNKVYLKHLGESGLSWCVLDPSGLVNVLVGRLGVLNDYDIHKALKALREQNPVIGENVVRGGFTACIPVRYPLTRMVGEGYLAIGDAAFMTIPMLGSGIASSMLSATILYEVLADNPDLSPANLWRYQVAFYKECGARHAAVDVMKRFMLQASTKELRYMFESGLLSEEDLKKASIGELVTVDFQSAKQKAKYFLRKPILMLKLIDVVNKAAMVYRRGMKIPEKYDTQKIKRWEKRIKYFFKAPKMVESPV